MTALSNAIDYTTLGWVKPELDETLRQARIEIEGFADEPTDTSRMRFCASYLHQVQGTLRMVELYAPAMVAEEMEHLAQALQHGTVADRDSSCATLMRGVVLLPDYLERLQSGHKDIPIVLMPLLNELRAARGEQGLSESVLFAPDLARPLPDTLTGAQTERAGPVRRAETLPMVERLSAAVAAWPEQGAPADIGELHAAIEDLLPRATHDEARRMLWVAASVADAMRDTALQSSAGLRQAFASVQREARRQFEDDGFGLPRPESALEPTRQLLYYVAHSDAAHPALQMLRDTFDLAAQLPSESEISHAQGSLSGRNRALLDTVSSAVKEDLLRVKDVLDLHVRTQGGDLASLQPQVETLGRVADTLGMLGLGVARNVVLQQRDAVQAIVRGDRSADEGALLDVAGALLYVDATLDDQVARLGDGDAGSTQEDLFSNESRKVVEVVSREAIANFADARQAFVAFVETKWDHAELAEVPRLLQEVAGAMTMLELPKPAAYLTGVRRYAETELIGRKRVPNGRQLDTLADALASLEYYLEALRENRLNRDDILDIARNGLETLGYWPLPALPTAQEAADATYTADIAAEIADEPAAVLEDGIAAFMDRSERPTPAPAETKEHDTPAIAAHAPIALDAGGFESTGDEIDDEIREVFLEEFGEEIDNLDTLLPHWREQPDDLDRLRPIRRVFHTLKGSGRLVGARALGEFSWKVEHVLNRVLDGRPASPAVVALVDQAFYTLPQLHAALRGEGRVTSDLGAIETLADRIAEGEDAFLALVPAVAAEPPTRVEDTASDVAEETAPAVAETPALDTPTLETPVLETLAQERVPASIDALLLEILDAEVAGHLLTVDGWIAQANAGPTRVSDLLLRAVHTMNGAFAMTEVPVINEALGPAEAWLRRMFAAQHDADAEGVGALAELATLIRATVVGLHAAPAYVPVAATLAAQLVALREALPAPPPPAMAADDADDDEDTDDRDDDHADSVAAEPDTTDRKRISVGEVTLTDLDLSEYADLVAATPTPERPQFDQTPDAAANETVRAEEIDETEDFSIAFDTTDTDTASRTTVETEGDLQTLSPFDAAAVFDTPATEVAAEARDEVEQAEALEAADVTDTADFDVADAAEVSQLLATARHTETPDATRAAEAFDAADRAGAPDANEDVADFGVIDADVASQTSEAQAPAGANETSNVPDGVHADETLDEREVAGLPEASVADEMAGATETSTTTQEVAELAAMSETSESLSPETAGIDAGAEIVAESDDDAVSTSAAEHAELEAARLDDIRRESEAQFAIERDEAARLEAERIEAERIEATHAEAERIESERLEGERLDAERVESERVQAERIEGERIEAERVEVERVEVERVEAERIEGERIEAERLEAERVEVERVEAERVEAEHAEAERVEAERVEAERVEAERVEAERVEAERVATASNEQPDAASLAGLVVRTEDREEAAAQTEISDTARALASTEAYEPLDLTGLDPELVDIFVEEAGDLLDHSDGLLAQLRVAPSEREPLIGLQRDLHTIKGGARMAGIMAVGELGHAMESLLESVVEQRAELGKSGVPLLERGFDRLHAMITHVGARHAIAAEDALIGEFNQHAGGKPTTRFEDEDEAQAQPAPVVREAVALKPLSAPIGEAGNDDDVSVRAPQEQVRIRADLLDRLVNYAGEVAIYRARLEQQLGAFRNAMGEMAQTNTRLRDQLRRLDIETEAQIIARYQREHETTDRTFDPLELDRFSTLQQLSRALGESAADLSSLQGTLDDLTRQYETLLLQQSRVSSDLQEGLMRTRMVPFDALVPRLRRVVRQASSDTGKPAQLELVGTHGELDRNVLERMTAPLEHMLRNAIAHGLESVEQRKQAKKPAEGVVRIAVRREGSEVVLEVSDDGRGLDRAAIRRRGEERGLVRAGAVLADGDLDVMIFEPGFSTADEVSRLAGRGVGMDVVASEVRQLGGALDVASREGEGATFTLRLPQTLAVTQAVFVKIGETNFAVPIASVRGVGRIARSAFEQADAVYRYAGEDYPVHDLGGLVGQAPARAEGQLQMPLLLIRSGDLRAAVAIDQIVGNREIVVKPVGPQVASIPGIFGATIMGDGGVVVILDIAPLVRRQVMQPRAPEPVVAVQQRRVPLVMVVDDSVTMRKVTSRVLERHNFEVASARDGIDALERMADRVPDLMLLDIEMPRMDGYELAAQMKADPRLREVPIVMITSRTGEKHRQRAFELGVEGYLGKPYQENELIRHVFDLLKLRQRDDD